MSRPEHADTRVRRHLRRATAAAAATALVVLGVTSAATGSSGVAAGIKPKPAPVAQVNGHDVKLPAGLRVDTGRADASAAAAMRASAASPTSTGAGASADATAEPSAPAPTAVSTDPALHTTDLGALRQDAAELAAMRSQATSQGSTRVIVTLNTSFTALGAMHSSAAAQQQASVMRQSDAVASLAVAHGGTVNRTYDGNVPAVALTATPATLDALTASPSVAKIDPDRVSAPLDATTTPLIGAADAQDRGYHGSGVVVAVMDTGVEYGHPYLGGRVSNAICFSTTNCPNGQTSQFGTNAGIPCTYSSDCDHGTNVAGIATGQTVDSSHFAGVADQARIEAVQVFHQDSCNGSPCARAYDSDMIAGLNAIYNDRAVGTASVNISIGGGQYTGDCDSAESSFKTAIDNLRSVNIPTVIAAGNSGYTNSTSEPGCISTAITVGATDNSDAVADFSNSSPIVDLYAPGVSVLSSIPGDQYAYYTGTSMAAPQVAGSIAIMKSFGSGFTADDEQNALANSGIAVTDSKSGLVRHRINVLQAIGQETIGLTNDAVRDLRNPLPYDHKFYDQTTNAYWSAVAIRPPTNADDDLNVYANPGASGILAGSGYGAGEVDFVAQDSNRASVPAITYPIVHQYSGTGRYQIEFANDVLTVGDATYPITMNSPEIIEIRDSYQFAGVPTHYRVVPSNSGQDPQLFLMESTAGNSASYFEARGNAVASSVGGVSGSDESFSYTSSASQYDGLVLINKAGSGGYTLYRDTSAPTGSMTIGAGDPAATNTRANTLQISAADSQTSIRDMRIVTDGTPDTEPWVAYSSTAPVTLTGAAGTKTVQVQVRNNANMISTFTDSITLDTRANYKVTAVSNPPATTTRNAAFSVTDTAKNLGLSAAAASSTSRYYLSLNKTYEAGSDVLLTGSRNVAALAQGASSSGTASVTVPATTMKGAYYLIACADTGQTVDEFSYADNCKASTAKTTVQIADYVVTSVANPPATAARGATFSATDTTKNAGALAATVASKTRYYLSADAVRDTSDKLLAPGRTVSALAAGAVSTGSVTVTVPATGLAPGTYRLLACADDLNAVDEAVESNNCKAATGTINVT